MTLGGFRYVLIIIEKFGWTTPFKRSEETANDSFSVHYIGKNEIY